MADVPPLAPARGAERRRCAVLGSPVAHSLSPVLHRAAYAHLGLDWTYDAVEVDETALPGFLAGLDASWRGLSLTMPLKAAGLACVDAASETARRVGGINTIVVEDGRRTGDSTDVPGLVRALAEAGAPAGGTAAVLGGGATARCALAALAGTHDAVEAYVRDRGRAHGLRRTADASGLALDLRDWSDAPEALTRGVVVATTPRGAADALAAHVPDGTTGTLLDVVYDPWPTALAAAWGAAGGTVASGLDLLVHQAVGQVALMTGRPVPVEVLRAAGRAALAARAG